MPLEGAKARRAGSHYVAPILRGTKPGDLPVEMPTKYELAGAHCRWLCARWWYRHRRSPDRNGAITIYKNGIDKGHCFQYQGEGACRQQFDAAGNRIIIDPVAGSAPLRIGTQDGESYFQGGIAALRIWSRALTNTEVCDLYQSDLVPPDGLVAQYLLDEGNGTVAVTSGGNNNATIYGATWMTM